MKRLRWKSQTGHDDRLWIGYENDVASSSLPQGGTATYTLSNALSSSVTVGQRIGEVLADGVWYDLVVTTLGSTITASVSGSPVTIWTDITGTSGTLYGDCLFSDLIIYPDGEDVADLTPSESPFTVSTSHSDDVFAAIKSGSGKISIVGNYTDAEDFYAESTLDKAVIFHVDGELEWAGYLKCEALSQPYINGAYKMDFNVVDNLNVLAGVFPSNDIDDLGLISIPQLLLQINAKLPKTKYQSFVFPADAVDSLFYATFYMQAYASYDYESEQRNMQSYGEILRDICEMWGLSVEGRKGCLYFKKVDVVNTQTASGVTYAYVRYTLAQLTTIASGGTATPEKLTWASQALSYITTNHRFDIIPAVSEISIKSSGETFPTFDILSDKYAKVFTGAAYAPSYEGFRKEAHLSWNRTHPNDQRTNVDEHYQMFHMVPCNGLICRSWRVVDWPAGTAETVNQVGVTANPKYDDFCKTPSYITPEGFIEKTELDWFGTEESEWGQRQLSTTPGGIWRVRERLSFWDSDELLAEDSGYQDRFIVSLCRSISPTPYRINQDCLVFHTGLYIDALNANSIVTNNNSLFKIFLDCTIKRAAKVPDMFEDMAITYNPSPGVEQTDTHQLVKAFELYVGTDQLDVNWSFEQVFGWWEGNRTYNVMGSTNWPNMYRQYQKTGGNTDYPKGTGSQYRGELILKLNLDVVTPATLDYTHIVDTWQSIEKLTISFAQINTKNQDVSNTTELTRSLSNGSSRRFSRSFGLSPYHSSYIGLLLNGLYGTDYSLNRINLESQLMTRAYNYYQVPRKAVTAVVSSPVALPPCSPMTADGLTYMPSEQHINYGNDQVKINLKETITS